MNAMVRISILILLYLSANVLAQNFGYAAGSGGRNLMTDRADMPSMVIMYGEKELPNRLPDNAVAGEESRSDLRAPCYTQAYDGTPSMFWPLPYDFYDISQYAVRFTACKDTLMSIEIAVYDPEDETFGNDDIRVDIHDDDCGEIGSLLASGYLNATTYPAYPTWATLDFAPLELDGDFYVVLSLTNSDDNESFLSDDGSIGTNRSLLYNDVSGDWWTMQDAFGTGYNLLVRANLCAPCGSKNAAEEVELVPHVEQSEEMWEQRSALLLGQEVRYALVDQFRRTIRTHRMRVGVEGDFPGNLGECTFEYRIQPCYVGGVFTDGAFREGEPFDIRRSKPKCQQDPCDPGEDDGCRWKYITECVLLTDWPAGEDCLAEPIDLQMTFYDWDWDWVRYFCIFGSLVLLAVLPYAAVTIIFGVGALGTWYGTALFVILFGAQGWFYTMPHAVGQLFWGPDWAYEKIIGKYNGPAITHPPVEGKHCISLELENTIRDKPAMISLTADVVKTGKKVQWSQGDPCNKPFPEKMLPGPEDLYYVSCADISDKELMLTLHVDTDIETASLLDPRNPPWDFDGDRKFVFYIDTSDCITDGCQGPDCCGAEFKVEFRQYKMGIPPEDWDTVKTEGRIYEYRPDCCPPPPGAPGWQLLSGTPYDIMPSHDYLFAKIRTEDIGDPSAFSFWVVSYRDDVMYDMLPPDACEPRTPFVRDPALLCPEVLQVNYANVVNCETSHPVYVHFTEPIDDPTGISISPPVGFSTTMDASSRILSIEPATSWPPGRYEITLPASIEDLGGNPLDGDPDTPGCGEPYTFEICVECCSTLYASDASATRLGTYLKGEHIYINSSGSPFPPNTSSYAYLILHRDVVYGTDLYDVTDDGPTNVTSAGDGSFGPVDIGTHIIPGEMSCVFDINGNVVYDSPDFVIGLCETGILAGPTCLDGLDGTAAWWTFNESGDERPVDIVAGNHGYKPTDGPTPVLGMVDGGFEFDGIDDYIEVPDADELDYGVGDFTVEFWMRTNDNSGVVTMLDNRFVTSDSARGWAAWMHNGNLGFQMADGPGSPTCSNDPNTSSCTNYLSGHYIADGVMNHVAISVDRDKSDGMKFYVNGSNIASFNPQYRDGSLDSDEPLRIGCHYDLTGFAAMVMDELTLYDRALTPAEIKAIYQAGSMGKCCTDSLLPECACFLAGGCGHSCADKPGDANDDSTVNVADAVWIVTYVFKGGPPPPCMPEGDANGDCDLNIGDAVHLINYVFKGGDPPLLNDECTWP